MKIHLVRGYKRHGKTSFAEELAKKLNVAKMSFATHLKREVEQELSLKPDQYDKDEILPSNFEYKTLREYYKARALKVKKDNPFYYAEKLFSSALEQNLSEIVIDDFRFFEEYFYLASFQNNEIIIYHVFNEKGKLPDENDMSERSLDDIYFVNEIRILNSF